MKKRLPKAQKGAAKIVKSVTKKVKPVTKAVKKPTTSRATNKFERELEAAIFSLEGDKLKKQFQALESKIKKKEGSLKPKKMQKGGPIRSKKIVRKKAISKKPSKELISRDPSKKIKEALGKAEYRKPIARKPKMQKGGTIKPPKVKGKEKRRLSQIDRRADRMIKKGADKRTVETMRSKAKMTPGSKIATKGQTKRMVKKMKKSSTKTTPVPTTMAKKQKGGTIKFPKLRGRTVTSKSGLTHRVNRRGAPKKNQGGGRPMSAKKVIRKMKRRG